MAERFLDLNLNELHIGNKMLANFLLIIQFHTTRKWSKQVSGKIYHGVFQLIVLQYIFKHVFFFFFGLLSKVFYNKYKLFYEFLLYLLIFYTINIV